MSREPISRIVSAYMYCKNVYDQLCGNSRFNFEKGTFKDFAEHWGNFLFRELLLFPDMSDVAKKQPNFQDRNFSCANEPWLQWKDRLNGGDDPKTKSGKENLKALISRLEKHPRAFYDINGILEKWDESLAMFDEWMPLRFGRTW